MGLVPLPEQSSGLRPGRPTNLHTHVCAPLSTPSRASDQCAAAVPCELAAMFFLPCHLSLESSLTDFTQGVERGIECWCYGQHQPLTNPCNASLLDRARLSQYSNQLFVSCCALLVGVSRLFESPTSFE